MDVVPCSGWDICHLLSCSITCGVAQNQPALMPTRERGLSRDGMAKPGILQCRAVKWRGRCLSGQMERKGRQQEKPTVPAKPYVQLPRLFPFNINAITAELGAFCGAEKPLPGLGFHPVQSEG